MSMTADSDATSSEARAAEAAAAATSHLRNAGEHLSQARDHLTVGVADAVIRSRPWATFGVAFAAGYLIAKLTRRS